MCGPHYNVQITITSRSRSKAASLIGGLTSIRAGQARVEKCSGTCGTDRCKRAIPGHILGK
jgi:hypothetical protein